MLICCWKVRLAIFVDVAPDDSLKTFCQNFSEQEHILMALEFMKTIMRQCDSKSCVRRLWSTSRELHYVVRSQLHRFNDPLNLDIFCNSCVFPPARRAEGAEEFKKDSAGYRYLPLFGFSGRR